MMDPCPTASSMALRLRRRPRRARAVDPTTATTSSGSGGCGPATALTVGDGAGRFRLARFGAGARNPTGRSCSSRRRRRPVTIAFALTKGDKPELVVQKLAEIGVDRIVPVRRRPHDRAVGRRRRRPATLERWRAIAREAAAQAHRPHLAEIVRGQFVRHRRCAAWGDAGASRRAPAGSRHDHRARRSGGWLVPRGGVRSRSPGCARAEHPPRRDRGPRGRRAGGGRPMNDPAA